MTPNDILNKYKIHDEEINPSSPISDNSSVCSDVTSSSTVSAAPSALRKGKYSISIIEPLHSARNEDKDNLLPKKSRIEKNVKLNENARVYSFPKLSPNDNIPLQGPINQLPSYVTLPNGVKILSSGFIKGRCSRTAVLLKKKWKEYIWVHTKPAAILVFRTLDDAFKWMNTKSLTREENKNLIKLSIDFDTMGALKKDKKMNLIPTANKPLRIMKYNMMDVKSKISREDGSIM